MTTLVHISDLHFGRIQLETIEPLVERINQIHPCVIAVSGDLTQRARSREFHEAKTFLNRLPSPQIIVPGNHDIPLHNLLSRFFQPLTKYRRYISNDPYPFYQDNEVAILGINTARSLTTKYGRINLTQMAEIRRRMCDVKSGIVKIVMTHHPFDLPEDANPNDLVGRAELAMTPLSGCGVDILLAGHMHVGLSGRTAQRYKTAGYSAIFVQAGTATSTRGRGEPNSFNVLKINYSSITIERLSWDAVSSRFIIASTECFQRTAQGWERNSIPPREV